MPQRNTTEQAIDKLTQADKDAADKKAEALSVIPDPVFEGSIQFDTTYSDHEFNVRDADSYGFTANKTLYASLKEKGLEKRGDMLSFSVQADGRLKVLVGNLRHNMMQIIRREYTELAAKDGREVTPESLPFATIFGLVYRNLTYGQETALMADHIMRKSFDEFELAKEIGEMMERGGITDAKASVHFGMDKNKIRRLRMRYAMPTVLEEYRKEKAKGDNSVSYVKVGNEQLDALYTAILSDRDMGCKFREEGSAFKRAWAVVISNPDAFKRASKDADTPDAKDRKKLIDTAKSLSANFGESPVIDALGAVLNWSAGEDVRLDSVALELKAYVDGILSERDEFAKQLITVTSERDAFRDECSTLQADLDGVSTELRDLKSDYSGLKMEFATFKEETEKTTVNGRRKSSK